VGPHAGRTTSVKAPIFARATMQAFGTCNDVLLFSGVFGVRLSDVFLYYFL
jgi:hypothetical protein